MNWRHPVVAALVGSAAALSTAALAQSNAPAPRLPPIDSKPAAKATTPAAPPARAAPVATEPMLDVCGRFPRAAIEQALGKAVTATSLNRTDPAKPPLTVPGVGGCNFQGPGLGGGIRIDVSTAGALARDGLKSPKHYVEVLWPMGRSGVERLTGVGEFGFIANAGKNAYVVIVGNAQQSVQLITHGVPRERVLAVARAAASEYRAL